MFDFYIYFPRPTAPKPPRQIGPVEAPLRYADQGVTARDPTPGRRAGDRRMRDGVPADRGSQRAAPAPPDTQRAPSPPGDDEPHAGDHVDTYA